MSSHRLRLRLAYAGGDPRLTTLAEAQERLCRRLGRPERSGHGALFDATPLWALSRPEEKFPFEPGIWRVLGPPTTPGGNVDLIRRHLLEKARVVAEHAVARRHAFVAAWPEKGGVSPLVGSANSRLSEALMNAIRDTLGPESFEGISSHPGRAYDRLLHAVAEMASGKKSAKRAFSDVLGDVPGICDAALDRPCAKERQARRSGGGKQKMSGKQQRPRRGMRCQRPNACSINRLLEPGRELSHDRNQAQRCLSSLRHMTSIKAIETKIALKQRDENIEAALKKLN